MFAGSLRKLTTAAIAVGVAWALSASSANAFWGHSSGGSSGGWGSSGGGYADWGSSGGSSGGWGSSGGHRRHHFGLFHRWKARRHAYHSSGGSSGGWGSSGGYYSSYGYGSSGGSSGYSVSYGSSGGWAAPAYPSYGVPVEQGPPPAIRSEYPSDAPEAPPALPEGEDGAPSASNYRSSSYVLGDSAVLNVRVPEEAKVYVNGMPTTSTGSHRRYISKNLRPGFTYTYELRAEVERDGEIVSETKTFKLTAGQTVSLAFAFAGEQRKDRIASKPATSLTLNVPADARVFLAGQETTTTGEVREFSTDQLAEGEHWADYDIRVEVERDGQTLAEHRVVSLSGGDQKTLTFDFDVPTLARASSER